MKKLLMAWIAILAAAFAGSVLAHGDKPAPAKIYFEVGKSVLPGEGAKLIEPIIAHLKSGGDDKIELSGFHDASGDPRTRATSPSCTRPPRSSS
jgi:hypothetical protein